MLRLPMICKCYEVSETDMAHEISSFKLDWLGCPPNFPTSCLLSSAASESRCWKAMPEVC